ncbi:MAG: signal peptidase I [Bacteroidetes bacterium]|nr:signal peptidase I [Bacteroidota bacterium]
MKNKNVILDWGKAILFAFFTILLFRIFFFEAFTIPSPSMEKSLLTGDYIIVSKLSYGPRIPNTPLSFPFAHQILPFTENTNSYLDWIQIPYMRLFGSPDLERNDVVVFNWPVEDERPVDQRTFYIKRCVAISGDTLELRDGQVYINRTYSDNPEKLQFDYKIKADVDSLNNDSLKLLGITEGDHMQNKGEFWFTLTLENVEKMKKFPHVTSVEPLIDRKGAYNDYMFPENEHFLWNVDFFGPIYIPKAGDSVKLTKDSLPLYERIIKVYEKNDLRVSNDSIFINEVYSTSYTFKMNYYFMMGDNRHNSADSRFWGFVPEDHIVGKTVLILMSIDKSDDGGIRGNRWFKSVD